MTGRGLKIVSPVLAQTVFAVSWDLVSGGNHSLREIIVFLFIYFCWLVRVWRRARGFGICICNLTGRFKDLLCEMLLILFCFVLFL